MNLEQLYKDILENDVSPSVFEFDPNPDTRVSMVPQKPRYVSNTPASIIRRKLGFPEPYMSPEEIEAQEAKERAEEEARLESQRQLWLDTFKQNHIFIEMTHLMGDLDIDHLKFIKSLIKKDDDYSYIYAGSKDRTLSLNIDDVCAHVVKSKIQNGKLLCEIEFDYSPAGIAIYNNYQNGFIPKLNLNTIMDYDPNIPNKQNMKFICLEFV